MSKKIIKLGAILTNVLINAIKIIESRLMKKKQGIIHLTIFVLLIFNACNPIGKSNQIENEKINQSVKEELKPGSQKTSPYDGMIMFYIPEGKFEMGSENGNPDESPVHSVYLDAFWIDQTEVTNEKYKMCEDAGACKHPEQGAHLEIRDSSATRERYYGNPKYADYPAIYVNFSQAENYCKWVGRRLPTEAEWEKAARGTDGRIYPWGNEPPNASLLNFDGNVGDTTSAGSYPDGASPYGALDMAGNVWEWVADWYDDEYYSSSPLENPTGPETGEYFTMRGGSWKLSERDVRTSFRHWYIPPLLGNIVVSHNYDGFRCAASP